MVEWTNDLDDDDSPRRKKKVNRRDLRRKVPLTPMQRLIAQECNKIRDMLLEKNRKYGNSALDPVRIFSKAPTDEQIKVRLDDKLSRLSRGQGAGEDVEFDLMGYLILLRCWRRMQRKGGK